jgi:hypothetical protein
MNIQMINKKDQLEKLNKAYLAFVEVVESLTPEAFLRSLGDWTPRDVVAHLIGWNRNILRGCRQILKGETPSYHADALNDYRTINAGFIAQYDSTDRAVLLNELAKGKEELSDFLSDVSELEWAKDFGPRHYRGGPATVSRAADSITGDYIEHTREIRAGQTR